MQEFSSRLTIKNKGIFCYDIVYENSFEKLGSEINAIGNASSETPAAPDNGIHYKKIFIITDSNVGPLYAESVKKSILSVQTQNAPIVETITVTAGEDHKNLSTISDIYRQLIEFHCDRKSLLIALGGGVIGDMCGYCAATYMRGIDYVQIPTTLLAQADSSIGGKTGVDFEGYKNMIGAFKMPRLVYANVSVLSTLDGRQFASGFAEVMKHGLILDEEYYSWLIENMYEILERDPMTLQHMLFHSNDIKRSVVEKDPYERKERMLLNFGHTIGHAIEKYRNFSLTHGECVALGCVAAAHISLQKQLISSDEYYEIRDMFVPFGLPITIEDIEADEIVRIAHSDKKASSGTISFILLKKIGKAVIHTDVTDAEMLDALKEITWKEDGE